MEYDGVEISDDGWKKVVHRKRKPAKRDESNLKAEPAKRDESNLKAEPAKTDESNLKAEETKNKKKILVEAASEIESVSEKPREVSLAEAAAKIDPSHLAAFLNRPLLIPGLELLNLVDYFGEALSGVSSVQFPWPNMDKLIDVIHLPLSEFPQAVYKTASDWIDQLPTIDTVAPFTLWSFNYIHSRLAGKRTPPKSHVSVFVVLAMILRTKPLAFFLILPLLNREPYQAEVNLPVKVWMIAEVSKVDLCLGLFSWAYTLLPLVGNELSSPQSMDLILQLVESIVSYPHARGILVCDSYKEDEERLISLPSFEILLRLTFPDSSQRVKDTERFEAVYPLLKELALTDASGTEAMKQLTLEIFTFSLNLAGQGNPVLAKEATSIAIWCVTRDVDCCNHWDNVYNDNPEASVALLRKLVDEWKNHSHKLSSSLSDTLTLNRTMKSFMLKNKKHITEGGANASLYKEADKYIKEILGRLSRASGFLKGIAIRAVLLYKEADKYSKEISGRLSRGSGFPEGLAISAVLLVAALAAAPVVLSSNLVGSFELHEYINAITTALKN